MRLKMFFPFVVFIHLLLFLKIDASSIVGTSDNRTVCVQPLPIGTCRRVMRYAYNPQTRKCVSFYDTGCGTTGNSFLTFEECRRDCMENAIY